MIGIGGAGMCGIAEILLNLGYGITGSDLQESRPVRHLRQLGAMIYLGHDGKNLGDVQVVVKSTAVQEDNPEVVEARKRGIPVIPRAEMLAELMRLRQGIAIAGTHGKTTTTSLTASIFATAGLDPTVIIGGRLNVYGTNAHLGKGKYLIAEADESDGSFLCLFPIINVVTNVDCDHMDYYGNMDRLHRAFVKFMNKVPFYGENIVCGDDPGVAALLPEIKRPVTTYGFGDGNFYRAVMLEAGLKSRYEVWRDNVRLGLVDLPQPGRHNVLNSLAAIAVAMSAGIDFATCARGLAGFMGVGRRFEKKGSRNGVDVIDDYGHHPAEIAATLATMRQVYPDRRLVVAFQPHRYSRTREHFAEFASLFRNVDSLALTEIYAASEEPLEGITGSRLAGEIARVSGTDVHFCPTVEAMPAELDRMLAPGDVLLTLGAGNITRVGPLWLERGGQCA